MSVVTSGAASFAYVGNADSQSVSIFGLKNDGHLETVATVPLQQPAVTGRSVLLALSPGQRFLYAAYIGDAARSLVATFAIDPNSGALSRLGTTQLADGMAYIATDRAGKYLLSASYAGNKVTVNAIATNGVVGSTQQVIATEPKAHCILTDPSNRTVLHTALGGDVIYQQAFDAATGTLAARNPPTVAVQAKAGPRFLIFSADGKFVYVVDELDGTIAVFAFDSVAGVLGRQVQTTSALPPGFSGQAWAADIHLTPDGRWLFVSERTTSTLAAFRVDGATGRLTYISSVATLAQPRAFAIDPSGRYLLSTGQLSNSVMSYSLDSATGHLTGIAEYPVGLNPTWVEIVRFRP